VLGLGRLVAWCFGKTLKAYLASPAPGLPRCSAGATCRSRRANTSACAREGTARLDQTVDAYRAALKVFRPAGASPYVGIAFHPACVLD
jgi:hypothetical protein